MATGLQACREPFTGELVEGKPTTFRRGDTLDPSKAADAVLLAAFGAYFEPAPSAKDVAAAKAADAATVWLVANQSAVATYPDGSDLALKENVTRVRADSDAAKRWPNLFKPMSTSYDVLVESATAGPGEKRGAA